MPRASRAERSVAESEIASEVGIVTMLRIRATEVTFGGARPQNFRAPTLFQGRPPPADEALMRRPILFALLLVAALAATFPHAASADRVFRPGELVVKRDGSPGGVERTRAGETRRPGHRARARPAGRASPPPATRSRA